MPDVHVVAEADRRYAAGYRRKMPLAGAELCGTTPANEQLAISENQRGGPMQAGGSAMGL